MLKRLFTRESVVKLFFDILHGIPITDITFVVALEFAIFLGYDGQLQQNSDLEIELFASIIEQMKKSNMTKIENALFFSFLGHLFVLQKGKDYKVLQKSLVWLYVKSWNHFGQHMLDEENFWIFGGEDLEAALTAVAYQRKTDKTERIKDLKNLIMERFDNNETKFFEWSRSLHNEVRFL